MLSSSIKESCQFQILVYYFNSNLFKPKAKFQPTITVCGFYVLAPPSHLSTNQKVSSVSISGVASYHLAAAKKISDHKCLMLLKDLSQVPHDKIRKKARIGVEVPLKDEKDLKTIEANLLMDRWGPATLINFIRLKVGTVISNLLCR